MSIKTEIKDFVRKVLLLGILLSFALNFAFQYFSGIGKGSTANASGNETNFKRSDTTYLGDTGVAIALNIGLSKTASENGPVRLYQDVMPISEVLGDKTTGQKKIIASHMIAIQEYMNVLQTDVNRLLDTSTDRQAMLESFIDQLRYRGNATNRYLESLASQRAELQNAIDRSNANIDNYKKTLASAYSKMDSELTEQTLEKYLEEKKTQTYATSYIVFLDKFVATETALNAYNRKLLDTITQNKEALIKNVTVTLPDSGNEFMKKLELLRNQGDVQK